MSTTPETADHAGIENALAGGFTVAQYITHRIGELAAEGVKQIDIAKAAGFDRPNVITMIKQSKTKLPLDKIGRVARALKIDPRFLFELTMREYEPGLWHIAKDVFGASMFLTGHEQRLVNQLREVNTRLEAMTPDEFDERAEAAVACFGPTQRIELHRAGRVSP